MIKDILKVAKLTENAKIPTKGTPDSAGYDLYSAYEYNVPPRGKCIVKTDIQISLPDNCYGRVAPRSGLAAKHGIDVGAGVIDKDYRGNISVILFNHSDQPMNVEKGSRIAQLICEKISYPTIEEVERLDITERNDKGFGSTGLN
ncbi:unnamed protein product [Gordionus sp. m RMFG-2023]|uniref:deoxyuridine 5'-triphosphate nucleotidohydrolase, mitochondrial-like n=1 Tax=Gordionus sp. m RMFG-2023 TaxID=3053472 RepID=UPI0030E069FB